MTDFSHNISTAKTCNTHIVLDMEVSGELGKSSDWNIETVIDWKRIVALYYQMTGKSEAAAQFDTPED